MSIRQTPGSNSCISSNHMVSREIEVMADWSTCWSSGDGSKVNLILSGTEADPDPCILKCCVATPAHLRPCTHRICSFIGQILDGCEDVALFHQELGGRSEFFGLARQASGTLARSTLVRAAHMRMASSNLST